MDFDIGARSCLIMRNDNVVFVEQAGKARYGKKRFFYFVPFGVYRVIGGGAEVRFFEVGIVEICP